MKVQKGVFPNRLIPGSRRQIVAYCAISAIVGLTLNLMPVNLGSAADYFGLEPRQIGTLGSALLWGFVLGCFVSYGAQSRVNWRFLVAGSLSASATMFFLSQFSSTIWSLYALWFFAGIGAGIPFSIAILGLTTLGDQERLIGLKLMCEVLVGAIFLYVVTAIVVPRWHYAGVAIVMALALMLVITTVRLVPPRNAREVADHGGVRVGLRQNLIAWIALAIFMIYFAGQIGLWAFMERIGRGINIAHGDIGIVLAVLKLVGAVTAGTVAVVGTKYGLRWPYLIGPACIFAGLYLLDNASDVYGYAAGSWVWDIGFELTGCYQMAAIARLDRSGHLAALIPAAAGIGAATGPLVGGYLAESGSYLPVYMMTGVCTLVAMIAFLVLMSPRRFLQEL